MSTPPPFLFGNKGKSKPKPKEGSAAEEKGESPAKEAKEVAAGKGDFGGSGDGVHTKKTAAKKKSKSKPGPDDMKNAIAKRLASLQGPGGPSPVNDNSGNASGGFPGM